MSSEFDRIKTLSESTRLTVYGYVRVAQQLFLGNNPYYNMYDNTIIISKILLFFDEPELFGINDKSSFNYVNNKNDDAFHIFGKKIITKGVINKHKWRIKTDKAFNGTFGVINVDGISKVKNDGWSYLWYKNAEDVACLGCKNGICTAFIFGDVQTESFIVFGGDLITIQLDYDENLTSFTSEKSKKTKTGRLKKGLKSVKFIAEFNGSDSVLSFC